MPLVLLEKKCNPYPQHPHTPGVVGFVFGLGAGGVLALHHSFRRVEYAASPTGVTGNGTPTNLLYQTLH